MNMDKRLCTKKNREVQQQIEEDGKEYFPPERTSSSVVESTGLETMTCKR